MAESENLSVTTQKQTWAHCEGLANDFSSRASYTAQPYWP